MGLLDSIKSKIKKEEAPEVNANEAPEPAVTGNHLPEPIGIPEEPMSAPPGMPELTPHPMSEPAPAEAYQTPAPTAPSPDIQNLRTQLEIINSKLDTLKAQIENLNQTLTVINTKLR